MAHTVLSSVSPSPERVLPVSVGLRERHARGIHCEPEAGTPHERWPAPNPPSATNGQRAQHSGRGLASCLVFGHSSETLFLSARVLTDFLTTTRPPHLPPRSSVPPSSYLCCGTSQGAEQLLCP